MRQTGFLQEVDLTYCRAGLAKRFANYIIDILAFYIFFVIVSMGLAYSKLNIITENEDVGIDGDFMILLCYGLVMFVIEATCNGKSLGKIITHTRAINSDGSDIGFQKAFLRSFIRCIPFDPISALGSPSNPWHDAWSHTVIIDERLFDLQRRKAAFFSELNCQVQTKLIE